MGEADTDRPPTPDYGETWVFESIVGAVPGIDVDDRMALWIQFTVFEALVLVMAAGFDRWRAALPGTVAVVVATLGSALMLDLGQRARAAPVPSVYRRLLFSANVEVVLGVVGYVAVIDVLFVYQPRHGLPFVDALLGPQVPLLAAFLLLLVLWDLCYRIGTAWWAALVSLWRSVSLDVDPAAAPALRAIDRRIVVFAVLQAALVPFLVDYPLLVLGLSGHVLAVLVVVGVARMRTRP